MNFYNDNDPQCCAWLRELIKDGLIPPGDVNERSITDIQPHELTGYTQCHFFAGIAGWSRALALAGWPAVRPVWTGSCPCQPLSCAGLGKGHADERHVWPAFYRLIAECRPPMVFGEQVTSKLGREWLSGVRADLERAGYAVGAADLCAAGAGAPHIRQRLYWVAHRDDGRCEQCNEGQRSVSIAGAGSAVGRLVDADAERCAGERLYVRPGRPFEDPVETLWRSTAHILCADGKTRRIPTQPALFPLADGFPGSRVGLLRGAGNAIVPPLAAHFIEAAMRAPDYARTSTQTQP